MHNVLNMLKQYFPKGSKIVELGCGKGEFITMVIDDNYFNIRGFDEAYDSNDNPFIEKRYVTESDTLAADLVVMRHVLEHIQNPYKFLHMLRKVFGNTAIFIEVPDLSWTLSTQSYFDITYEHVNYFTPKTLKFLFNNQYMDQGIIFNGQYQYIISNLGSLNSAFDNVFRHGNWEYSSFEALFPEMLSKLYKIEQVCLNKRVFLWGAATKGCLFALHSSRSSTCTFKIEFAVDINLAKVGKFIPGTDIEIKNTASFLKTVKNLDCVIVANPIYLQEVRNHIFSKRPDLNSVTIISL